MFKTNLHTNYDVQSILIANQICFITDFISFNANENLRQI